MSTAAEDVNGGEASARCPSCNRIVNEDRHCCGDPPAVDDESERLLLLREQRRLLAIYGPTLVSVAVDAGEAAIVLDETKVDIYASNTRIIDNEETDQ